MRYTLYRKNPDGSLGEAILQTDNRPDAVRMVAELLFAGEAADTLKLVEDEERSEPHSKDTDYFFNM